MIKKFCATVLSAMLLFTVGCTGKKQDYSGSVERVQKDIRQIKKMPDRPSNYKYKNYMETALKLDALLYDFAKKPDYQQTHYTGANPTYAPVGYWTTANTPYFKGKAFGVPSYIGHVSNMGQGSIALANGGHPEGVTTLGTVYGASLSGIDKSNQTFTQENAETVSYDFVEMARAFYSDGFILNNMGGKTGNTFWYEVYPQILFARILNLYQRSEATDEIIIEGAHMWVEALNHFKDSGNGKFWYTSFNFMSMKPVLGMWAEPVNGGAAFLLLNAYKLTGNVDFLEAAKEYMDFCQTDIRNPNYEILTDYLPYAAAYTNFLHGTNYDVQKFVNFIFDADDDARPTGIVRGKWGNFDANGLMAYDNWNNTHDTAWAFTMNTFHIASTLVPMLRYDNRFADDVGKWMLLMTNSARMLYRDELPQANRSKPDSLVADPDGVVAYEGTSKYKRWNRGAEDGFTNDKWDNSISPYAMGDPTLRGWGKTDFGVYGGGHVGIVGGLVKQTNVEEILQIDVSKADDFKAKNDVQHYLYYNPYSTEKTVEINLDEGKYNLVDTITQRIVKNNAIGKTSFVIPAQSSVILALCPFSETIKNQNGALMLGDVKLAKSINVSIGLDNQLNSRMSIANNKVFNITAQSFNGDKLSTLTVTLNDKVLYDGQYKNSFTYQSSMVANSDFVKVAGTVLEGGRNIVAGAITYYKNYYEGELRFTVKTISGASDSAMIRIRKA